VLTVKAYSVLVLYALWIRQDVRAGYEPFVFLASGESRAERLKAVDASFLERLAPYDGQFYLDIAERGYRVFDRKDVEAARGPPGNYAFFPLFPWFLRAARSAGPMPGVAIAIVFNVLLSAAAAVALFRLAERVGCPAWTSVLFLVTFPTAVFQTVLYSESLFLFLSVGVGHCALSGRSSSGAGLGFLAGLCRPQGVLVSVLWAGAVLRRKGSDRPLAPGRLRALGAAVAPLAGLAVFALVLWTAIGAPLGFLSVQREWSRDFSASQLLREVFSPGAYEGPTFDWVAVVLGVGLVPFLWRYLPWPLALFGTLSVVLPLATGTMLSFGRFLSVSFPHFLCLAKLFERWRVATAVLVGSFVVLQSLVAMGLVSWYFVG
jgi:hypothetical protein